MITHIVATGLNLEIGKDNKLPWHLPEDLQHFKQQTMGKTVVLGANTYRSIQEYLKGKQFLQGREAIVISSSPVTVTKLMEDIPPPSNVRHWVNPILKLYVEQSRSKEILIIGGQQLYNAYPADRILLTEVQTSIEDADTFYNFNKDLYDTVFESEVMESVTGLKYKFIEYVRKV